MHPSSWPSSHRTSPPPPSPCGVREVTEDEDEQHAAGAYGDCEIPQHKPVLGPFEKAEVMAATSCIIHTRPWMPASTLSHRCRDDHDTPSRTGQNAWTPRRSSPASWMRLPSCTATERSTEIRGASSSSARALPQRTHRFRRWSYLRDRRIRLRNHRICNRDRRIWSRNHRIRPRRRRHALFRKSSDHACSDRVRQV